MFDRFGLAMSAPSFGARSGALAVGVHAVILAFGLHSSRGPAAPTKAVTAPDDIWVIPAAATRALVPPSIVVGTPNLDAIWPGPILIAPPVVPGGTLDPSPGVAPAVPSSGPLTADPDRVYSPELVEQPPELLSAPLPRYPDLLREARVQGIVVIEGVVDTLGRMERATLRVVSSPHPALSASAEASLVVAVFRPGRVWGRAVRVLVQVPVRFQLTAR